MLVIDLCCGLKGATEAHRYRGWEVITVDIEPTFSPDYCCDVREFAWPGRKPDLIWASPPCTDFARESMPWCRTGETPDLSIFLACWELIQAIQPRYWVIENVRGSIPYFEPILGRPAWSQGPYFLWGYFPSLGRVKLPAKGKESISSRNRTQRSKIPFSISEALATAIESQLVLPI